MLLSKPLSRPEIRVPIKVTDKTPIIIPSAVKIDRDLFEKIEFNAMRKLSIKIDNIMQLPLYYYSSNLLSLCHQK